MENIIIDNESENTISITPNNINTKEKGEEEEEVDIV